jgi:DNA-directed RNA polymerase alpha subunit
MTSNQDRHPDSDLPARLSEPARRALAGAGYHRLDQLTAVTEAELKRLHGMGPRGLDLLRAALAARGLALADAKGKRG